MAQLPWEADHAVGEIPQASIGPKNRPQALLSTVPKLDGGTLDKAAVVGTVVAGASGLGLPTRVAERGPQHARRKCAVA